MTDRGKIEMKQDACRSWLLGALGLLAAAASVAQEPEPGSFEIDTAGTTLENGVYYLDARASLELSSEAEQALASGLTLTIRYEVEFLNRLRLWWDTEEATLRQLYRVEFHVLTNRFVVLNGNSGDQLSFQDLSTALDYVGRIDRLPLIDAAVLDRDRRYDVRVRVVLDTDELPGPLRLIAFWRRDWSLGSDWYSWRLDEE
jgi:hypothetical protein